MCNPFRYFNSSPEVIRLTVMMYTRYPMSLRQVEDLLFERGIDIRPETVRFRWNRFGPIFAAETKKKRSAGSQGCAHVFEADDEAPRSAEGHRDRPSSLTPICNEGARHQVTADPAGRAAGMVRDWVVPKVRTWPPEQVRESAHYKVTFN